LGGRRCGRVCGTIESCEGQFLAVVYGGFCGYDWGMDKKKGSGLILGLVGLLLVPVLVVVLVSLMGVRPVGTPLVGAFTVENGYRSISAEDGRSWRVIFQWPWDSTFEGSVRHVSLWDDADMPFMSHDILVTSGEYADAERVSTSVRDHHYFYSYGGRRPKGDISLLHIFPASQEVLEDLMGVALGDEVRIEGREIFLVNVYDAQGNRVAFFTDTGCNTILVTGVEVLSE
jgi:hypothetical protein